MGDNNTPDERQPRKRATVRAAVVPLLGLAVVLVGCIVAWNSNATESFGWFAYAPLSNQVFSGTGTAFVSQGTRIGLAIAVVGLLLLAFWAGYRTGRNSSPNNP
ncbi:conserved exported hypothetical protein [Arthrobacter sp. 9AX]|uniref:hypothetical protein n=1 Tax=Arthrobacter sp. 9AX TaxID=2653131 RepID=UPI0012F03FCF|nr:hypothetical protein [Arthrobacter sp. 9AX]VXC11734.1 conserved exported hypothetical protein [Arthrobacter sp. 9AX]